MYFDNIHDIFYMDGHGIFVWICYIVVFGSIGWLCFYKWRTYIRIEKRAKITKKLRNSHQSQ